MTMIKALSPRLISRKVWPVVLCVAAIPMTADPAFAQHAEMQDIASHLADDLANAGRKRIVVADFVGPEENFTQLGKYLSLELTAALAWTGKGLEPSHTILLPRLLREQPDSTKDQTNSALVERLGKQAEAETVVLGELESTADSVAIHVRALDASDGRLVAEAAGRIQKTPIVGALLAKSLSRLGAAASDTGLGSGPKIVDGAYMSGIGGVGRPSCVDCPEPTFSEQAREAKISGTVVLHLIVTPEGRATNIQ